MLQFIDDLVVQFTLVVAIDIGQSGGERTVNKYRRLTKFAFVVHVVENVQHELRSPQRERRDDDATIIRHCSLNDAFEMNPDVRNWWMGAIAVSAFANQCVAAIDWSGIAQQWHVALAEIAAKDDPPRFSVVFQFDLDDRRAEDVTSVVESNTEVISQLMPFLKTQSLQLLAQLANIVFIVERLDARGVGMVVALFAASDAEDTSRLPAEFSHCRGA